MKSTWTDLNEAQSKALLSFKQANGRQWKSRLLNDWSSDNPQLGGELRQIRNAFGPTWLLALNGEPHCGKAITTEVNLTNPPNYLLALGLDFPNRNGK